MSTRLLIEAAWAAHVRRVNVVGAIQADAASASGQLLEAHGGDARAARDDVPKVDGHGGKFWERVREYLARVVEEEAAAERKTGT